MKIAENSFVSLSYELKVDGNVVDASQEGRPLNFLFGKGMLLPQFEANVAGKGIGESFEFTLTPAEGYGEVVADAIVDLPKEVFTVDGNFDATIVAVGETLPMMDNQGHQMYGKVIEVTESIVKMDFNHPMAGQTLNFTGSVLDVREATDADIAAFMPQQGGGCSCGSECNCDGDCGEEGSCCQ